MLVELVNVSHEYRREPQEVSVLDSISLCISNSEIISLLGPSGCGKSTLLKILSRLIEPSSGERKSKLDDSKDINFVFQKPTLLRWRTTIKNILLPLELRKVEINKAAKKECESLIYELGFKENEIHNYPSELSVGMQHRVAIARALITKPKLLLLDEPFNSLDLLTKQATYNLVDTLHKRHRFAMLLVTHDVLEAVQFSDRIILLSEKPARIILNDTTKPYQDKNELVKKIKNNMNNTK